MARSRHRPPDLNNDPPAVRQNAHIDADEFDEQYFRRAIDELREIAAREGEPANLRRFARSAADTLAEALDAAVAGTSLLTREIIAGTVRADGKKANDGLLAILPKWARGPEILDALVGVVAVDESVIPPTVTVHWERVPRHLRAEAASLASELVDIHYGRPKGGRGKTRDSDSETG